MAIVANAQQTAILQITQAMLGAAPGAQLMNSLYSPTVTLASVAALVAATPTWKTDMGYGSLSNLQTYQKLIESMVGSTVTPANKSALAGYLDSVTGTGKTYASASDGIAAFVSALAGGETNADWGTAAKMFNSKVLVDAYYTLDKVGNTSTLAALQAVAASVTDAASAAAAIAAMDGNDFTLTTAQDNIIGSTYDDVFTAILVNNANTLQAGDYLNGSLGNDTLNADFGNTGFAITPQTLNLEKVSLRAQVIPTDASDNNLHRDVVQLDAQRMVGVNHWVDNNSRADLIIEDVRILDTQITRDITIEMNGTDPGHVDFGVYFDPYSLRNVSQNTGVLNLEIIDTRAAVKGQSPLLNSPYDGIVINFAGTNYTLESQEINDAQTYDQLVTALQNAIAANATLKDKIIVQKNGTFPAVDTDSGITVYGDIIALVSTVGAFVNAAGTGWIAAAPVPPDSGFHTQMIPTNTSTTDLVTSKVILDDVGRSNLGGDLVIGSMSTGEINPAAGGVQRFEIEVRDNSQLQTINSTNNALREVQIVSGKTSNMDDAYYKAPTDKGDLTVLGTVLPVGTVAAPTTNSALPGTAVQHDSGYGFSDVRLIDASTFNGKLTFDAQITDLSIEKYINLKDTAANPAADNINFVYTGGNGNDSMTVQADGGMIASRSRIVAGREDFTLALNGGAGDDSISLRVVTSLLPGSVAGNTDAWYNNQDLNNNVTINGGAGNDTIRKLGAGDTILNGDAGNDTIYSDNTGAQPQHITSSTGTNPAGKAVWVFNTADQTGVTAVSRNYNDLRSDFNGQDLNLSYNLYKYSLTVTFKGIETALPVTIANTATYKMTDLELNQAIKTAINSDATLSKLLVAEDGPANILIVKSLIDGTMAIDDLALNLRKPADNALTPNEVAAMITAYKLPTTANEIDVRIEMDANWGKLNTSNDYKSAWANDGAWSYMDINGGIVNVAAIDLVGRDSSALSDNIITPGADNDIIVLGTTVMGATKALASNEVIKYAAGFGNDVVVNFAATGAGIDHFDFNAINGKTIAAYTVDKSINIEKATYTTSGVIDTTAIQGKYAATQTVATDHVYVAVSDHNIGYVYTIHHNANSPTADVPVLQGSIHLEAGALWLGDITAANFVNSGGTYYLEEGPAAGGIVPPGPTPPPSNNLDTLPLGSSYVLTTGTAYALTDSPTVNNNVTLAGFDANDSITIGIGATQSQYNASGVISSTATATVAGDAVINYVAGGITNKIVLTGVVPAGVTVNSIATFNALAVGDLTVPADPGPVVTDLSVDGKGTDATPETIDASVANYNLKDAVSVFNNVLVNNYTSNDKITISGATSAQYDTSISTNGTNVEIVYNNNGTLNTIVVAGVATGLVYDVASFNALPVGDIFFA